MHKGNNYEQKKQKWEKTGGHPCYFLKTGWISIKKILCYIDKNKKYTRGKIVEKHHETWYYDKK